MSESAYPLCFYCHWKIGNRSLYCLLHKSLYQSYSNRYGNFNDRSNIPPELSRDLFIDENIQRNERIIYIPAPFFFQIADL